ncbi:MAG TPA: class I SAM-dependent methyltransferase [Phycisphaerales bacterium]|nr:class I SAM-dependent methyltransferase [Phycisphaerales bacterium]
MPSPISSLMAAMHKPVYARRLRELVSLITPHLREGDRVLDVGCGNGTLGDALMIAPNAPRGLIVEGLERYKRGGEPITVHPYDGVTFPFPDASWDVVILADVLHHEEDPDRLVRECVRVSRRLLIIKDHQLKGPLAKARVSLIDWAANAPYGVKCLYRYNTPNEWRAWPAKFGAAIAKEYPSIVLYPPVFNQLFGNSLQYLAVWNVPERAGVGAALKPAPRENEWRKGPN